MRTVCSVYDGKAEYFMDPFTCRTRAEAARHFMTSVQNPANGMLHQHPEDYTLFFLGEFNEFNGSYSAADAPVAIINGLVARGPSEEETAMLKEVS